MLLGDMTQNPDPKAGSKAHEMQMGFVQDSFGEIALRDPCARKCCGVLLVKLVNGMWDLQVLQCGQLGKVFR